MISQFDQSYFVHTHSDIDSIIQPLKDFFGITSFVYQKNFLNGSEIRLTNQPRWISYFFEEKLYNHSLFEHAPPQYVKGHVLWSGLPEHEHVLSLARQFNIDHGITFIEPQVDGVEFFFFGHYSE
ncbi:MAG TPA: hypothetical protein VHE99_03950 [Gammaproteobacteria bacterium]|nr:hypothetical protein [Gammaproteobacteria bacterium]